MLISALAVGVFWATSAIALIDECVYTPCQHGGTCSDLYGRYHCTCTVGWTSGDCSVDDNECASTPCLNGAVCVESNNDNRVPIARFSCSEFGLPRFSPTVSVGVALRRHAGNLGNCIWTTALRVALSRHEIAAFRPYS